MKIQDFIKKLESIKESLQDKEIVIVAPNGLLLEPAIRFLTKDNPIDLSKENVESIVITY